jgi:hypothetical protein
MVLVLTLQKFLVGYLSEGLSFVLQISNFKVLGVSQWEFELVPLGITQEWVCLTNTLEQIWGTSIGLGLNQ